MNPSILQNTLINFLPTICKFKFILSNNFMQKNNRSNASKPKRQSNKQNQVYIDPRRQLATTMKFERRTSQSIGKIIKNRTRTQSNILGDIMPDRNANTITSVNPSNFNSAVKRKRLEEKYQDILGTYQAKQKDLDNQMRQFESSHTKVVNPRNTQRQQLPILTTSEFNIIGARLAQEQYPPKLRIQELQTCKVITKRPSKKQLKHTKHHTEGCQTISDSQDSCIPLQRTQPEHPKNHSVDEVSVINFISAIGEQIDLEAELRKWKNRVNKKLQPIITKAIEDKGIPKEILKVDFEEYEIFGRDVVSTPQIISTNIIRCYQKCEEHWQTNLIRKFSRRDLKQVIARLDYDGTGIITPKILARELSIMTNRNLRVRDVFKVCGRLSTQQNITITSLMKSLKIE